MVYLEALGPRRGEEFEIDRSDQQFLGEGVCGGRVTTVDVQSGKFKRRMAEKVFPVEDLEEVKRERAIHALLQEAKIPTIPTLMIDPKDGRRLYLTDLTEGGKVDCISIVDFISEGRRSPRPQLPLIELVNPDEIIDQVLLILERSIENGIILSSVDIYFLLVNKETRRGRVIVGDLERVRKYSFVGEARVNYVSFNYFLKQMNAYLSENSRFDMSRISQWGSEHLG
jgi:hypothetical protein